MIAMTWTEKLKAYEIRMFNTLNGKYRSPWLDLIMRLLTHIGGAVFCIGLLLVLSLNFKFTWNGLIALTVSHVIIQVLKRSFRRRRPYVVEATVHFITKPLKDASFPSGHSTAVFATCVSIALVFPWLSPILLVIACFVGWSRIYLGVHYPGDVVVGALIGGLTAIIVHMIA